MYKSYISKTIGLILIIGLIFIIGRNILLDKMEYRDLQDDIVFSGRWFTKDIDGKEMHVTLNQGAMLYFAVEETEIIDVYFQDLIKMGGTPYFAYSIDGGDMVRQSISDTRITLPDEDEHFVTIIIDSLFSVEDRWNVEKGIAFEKVDCHGGKINTVDVDRKRILFVGDSITEGIMSQGYWGICADNSAINSYVWIASETLGYEPYYIAYGGIGIYSNGSFTTISQALDYLSAERAVEDVADFELIVFNIGSNDEGITSEDYIDGYQKVILKLHERYSDIDIVCMTPINQKNAEDIKKAVEDYNWCHVVETADWSITTSDGTHPIGDGCEDMANKLVEYIEEHNLLND